MNAKMVSPPACARLAERRLGEGRGRDEAYFCAAVILAISAAPISSVSAACVGTPGFQTCNDNYGNSYTVNRMGPMTQMYGNNRHTGSTWSQTSQSLGNMTMHHGDHQRASVVHESEQLWWDQHLFWYELGETAVFVYLYNVRMN